MLTYLLLVALVGVVQGADYQGAIDKLLELDAKLLIDADEDCINNPNVPGPKLSVEEILKINLTHFTNAGRIKYQFYPDGVKELINSLQFDRLKPLVVMVHSELDSSLVTGDIETAFNSRGQHNVIDLDCGRLLVPMTTRAEMSRYIGEGLAIMLMDLMDNEFNFDNIFLIGHEIGAHVIGFAGKAFKVLTNGEQLTRLIGLNPSSRCFEKVGDEGRLSAGDGYYVQVIHTKSGNDLKTATGDVDFYLVDSLPSAPWLEMWHTMIWRYYAESVKNDGLFVGIQCDSLSSFQKKSCTDLPTANLGYRESEYKTGTYYMRVGLKSPFGLGSNGISP